MTFPLYIDISEWQPINIDWAAYRAWSAQWDGVSMVAFRSSQGTGYKDKNFDAYRAGAQAAGIDFILIYHYAYPQYNPNAADEADWQASVVGVLHPNELLMLDFEENVASGLDSDWALAWLRKQEENYKQAPAIYASKSMVVNRLQDSRLARYPLILAEWTYDPTIPPLTPAPWKQAWAWQFTEKLAGVPGIPAGVAVDANVYTGGEVNPVLDLQRSYQLNDPGESQDMCGPWSVAELFYAGPPGQGPRGTAQQIDDWAEQEYTTYIGPNVSSDQQGSSIDNMHQFLTDAGLHYWDISAINPSSQQASDLAHVKGALNAGYPVLATVNEQSLVRRDGSNPYPWQPALGPVTHIFTIVGYTADGFFIVDDELNSTDWPSEYAQANIEMHWASIVQVVGPDPTKPWLLPIPSGDPTTWPAGFNARNFPVSGQQQQAADLWAIGHKVVPILFPGQDIMDHSGIASSWNAEFAAGRNHGHAVTPEIKTVNWSGVPIVVQYFADGSRCEWDGAPHWYHN